MKKIISAVIAAAMLFSLTAALAQDITVKGEGNAKAILLCYDGGKLVYSSLLKTDSDVFDVKIPSQYDNSEKKVYYIGTQEFKKIDDVIAEAEPSPSAAQAPEATDAPAVTTAPTATPKATAKPSSAERLSGTPYEKEADTVYSPAVIIDVASDENSKGEEIYTLTVFYQGKEMNVEVDRDITISNVPDAHKELAGASLASLEKGDVVYLRASISGDDILSVDLITRPPKDDIVTDTVNDYGASFEKLFASNGLAAGRWKAMTYGAKAAGDRYQYAFGIVGKMSNGTLTLLNKSGSVDNAIDLPVDENAYVYSCDVNGKEYELEIGGRTDITSSLPSKALDKDVVTLDGEYSYNYALALVIDGIATDVIVYNNYNY